MSDDAPVQHAIDYLTPSAPSFWRWDDDARWLAWADGRSIAFRDEAAAVLSNLAAGGLPPFGSIVLLLAACRDQFDGPGAVREGLLAHAREFFRSEHRADHWLTGKFSAVIDEVCHGLARVAALPANLRASTGAKALLAEVIFEGAERELDAAGAAATTEALGLMAVTEPRQAQVREFAAVLDALRHGLGRVDAGTLQLRLRTGLEQLPSPAKVMPPSQQVRELLAELRGDPELGGVVRLAQNLMAAVHVPRALHSTEELPMGGVSDLTNRGPFDRLLVSELAHDDLTLAVRVAMNEALYLRRESPPRQPPSRRTILIDTGIRLWGLPRVFATACALALAATADPRGELEVFRASGDRTLPVNLTTREGLVALLEALTPEAHPAAAMGTLFQPPVANRKLQIANPEILVITHADTLKDATFQRESAGFAADGWYAATVDRQGGFTLAAIMRGGRKPVAGAQVDLDRILADPPGKPGPLPLRDEAQIRRCR